MDVGPQEFDMAEADLAEEEEEQASFGFIWKSRSFPSPRSLRPSPRAGEGQRFDLTALDEDASEEREAFFAKLSLGLSSASAPLSIPALDAGPASVGTVMGCRGTDRLARAGVERHAGV